MSLKGSGIPHERFVVPWKKATKEGHTALLAFARLADRPVADRDAVWEENAQFAVSRVQEAAERCNGLADELVEWLHKEKRAQAMGAAAAGSVGVVVEAFGDEATMRHHIADSLGQGEHGDGYHACVVAWKLSPFLSSDAVATAVREIKFYREIESLQEMEARHA